MEKYLEDNIEQVKKFMFKQVKNDRITIQGDFIDWDHTYFWCNEYINDYLNLVSLDDKQNALSVLSSGDHVFNLVTKGIIDIDSFDSNKMTEYFALGLKRAMILKYNYNEFLEVTNKLCNILTCNEEIYEIIIGLYPYMQDDHHIFWNTVINYNYEIQKFYGNRLNLIRMLCIGFNGGKRQKGYIDNNNYLQNEESYNRLRNLLSKANISFTHCKAHRLNDKFSEKYDVILLSNILDYFSAFFGTKWDYQKLYEFEKILEELAKKDGLIFLHYIWGDNPQKIFSGSIVKEEDFRNEKILQVSSQHSTDKIILKRVK